MMSLAELLSGCAYGAREWLFEMNTSDTAPAAIRSAPVLLPALDVKALIDPLRGSVFESPGVEQRQIAAVPGPRRGGPPAVGQAARTVVRQSIINVGGTPSASPPGAGPFASTALTLSTVLERIESFTTPVAPAREPASKATASAAGIDKSVPGSTASASPSNDRAIREMYRTVVTEAERRIHESVTSEHDAHFMSWENHGGSFDGIPGDGAQAVASGAFTGRDEPRAVLLRSLADGITSATSARPPAVRDPTPAAASSEVGETGEDLVTAVSRLVETLSTFESRIQNQAAVSNKLPEAPGEADTVDWLAEDDLAARLQAILSRQARRRGIDLS